MNGTGLRMAKPITTLGTSRSGLGQESRTPWLRPSGAGSAAGRSTRPTDSYFAGASSSIEIPSDSV